MQKWTLYGEELTPENIKEFEDYYGFIYEIFCDNKWYFGRKAFVHKTKKVLSKKAKIESGNRKRIERGTKDSGWQEYYGSCKPLLEYIQVNGIQGVTRNIIGLCTDRQSLAYWEIVLLIEKRVLFEDSWNSNVGGKFFKGKIQDL